MKTTLGVFRAVILVLVFALILTVVPALAKDSKQATAFDKEVQLGKDAVKDIEKDCKLIQDEAVLARVRSIGEKLAKAALSEEVPASYGDSTVAKFNYTFKVIDDKTVNAFCLPGGFIYVHKGLLDFVQSDHELAAVLAHEIAHAAHHHVKSLMREQSKMHSKLALVLLAGLIGNLPQSDLSNVLMGTQFYKIARLNAYGQKAEADADTTALAYLAKTDYNPVGMLTFLERLSRNPELVQLGIFQTHPRVDDRVEAVTEILSASGVKIDRRKVIKAAKAELKQVDVNGRKIQELLVGGKPVIRLSGDAQRAKAVAAAINDLLETNIAIKDVRTPNEHCNVTVKDRVVLQVNAEDAVLNGVSQNQTACKLTDSLKRVLWQEMVELIR